MKIDILKTVSVTMMMVVAALLISVAPPLFIILAPVMLVPPLYLYMKSKRSFFVMAAIVVVFSMIAVSLFAFQVILAFLIAAYITGQLLNARASREFMLFALTVLLSMYALLSIIFMQLTKVIPTTTEWFDNVKDLYAKALDQDMPAETLDMFYKALDMMQLQLPGVIVFFTFLLALLMLVIAMPLLRRFKIATPNFRPLPYWQVPKSVFYLYMVTLLAKLFLSKESVVPLGIVINLEYVLEWIIFIQGLSLIAFYMKAKKTPVIINVLMFLFAFIMAPITQLLGMLDLILNIKRRIKIND